MAAVLEISMQVLCVSTLTNVGSLHHKREMTLLQALRERGAAIDYIYCGGMDGVCDGLRDISPKECRLCRDRAEQQALEAGLSPRVLLTDETAAERLQAAQWAASLADDALMQAEYNGYPLGRWCLSSVYTYWRVPNLSPQDIQAKAWYRALLEQGLRLVLGMEKLLDAGRYDRVVVYNARMAYVKIPFELARRRGLAVYTHERAGQPGHCWVALNGLPFNQENWDRLWSAWKDVPLSAAQLGRMARYLDGRRQGDVNSLNWFAYTTKPGHSEALRQRLGIPEDKAVWALFSSSNHELLGRDDIAHEGFATQQDWIEAAVAKAAAYPGVKLVIRAHPNLSNLVFPRRSERELRYFADLKRSVGDAVVVIEPEEDVSSYDLMDIASASLCYVSTCGLESAMLGKPVAIAANPFYKELPGLDKTYDPAAMDRAFARYAALPPGWRDQELRRKAYRIWYTLLFRYGFELPFVHAPNLLEGRYAWFSPDALRPGVHKHLDLLCEAIFAGLRPQLLPGPDDLARGTADEECFLRCDATEALKEAAVVTQEAPGPRYFPVPLVFVALGTARQSAWALEALSQNIMAAETDLHVVCADGHAWREIADLPGPAAAFRSVSLETAPAGLGLCAMTVRALSSVLQTRESAIALDDALYCAPHTLAFYNNALHRYRYRHMVGCVSAGPSGAVAAALSQQPGDAVFAPRANALGLGVWRDRWAALAPTVLAELGGGAHDDARRPGLQRLIAALCAERGALCVAPKQAGACLSGPEGAPRRQGFAPPSVEPVLPFAPDAAASPSLEPGAEERATAVRRRLAERVAGLARQGRPVLVTLDCAGQSLAEPMTVALAGDAPEAMDGDGLGGLGLPERSCDALYACRCLEHLSGDEARRFLAQCRRALRPGGVLRLAVADGEGQARAYLDSLDAARRAPDDAEAVAHHERFGGRAGQAVHDELSLGRLLGQCGFTSVLRQSAGRSAIRDFVRQQGEPAAEEEAACPGLLYMEGIA